MTCAGAQRLREIGARIAAIADRAVQAELPLPVAGLLSDAPLPEVVEESRSSVEPAQRLGCVLPSPFQTLAFLALFVIPKLKIEATVVFYAMASSAGEDVPRGVEFLFSRNRLNVAISRARCLAYVVATPRLLEANSRTVEQMRLVNALCRFVEVADDQARR